MDESPISAGSGISAAESATWMRAASARSPFNDHRLTQHPHHQQQQVARERALAGHLDEDPYQQQQRLPQEEAPSVMPLSDLVLQYVNLNLVRKMIAQNLIEFIFVCVIITYLIYYFSQVSRRPKLVGNDRSGFVQFVKQKLDQSSLLDRFSPLIYFWGTNPQTALFGYLQGQTSLDEMPRSKFKRQYLYVSDAQYLMSNVDLSQHYRKRAERCRQSSLQPLQLQPLCANQLAQQQSQLDQNIRLALDGMLLAGKPLSKETDLSSSGSSSDSGVFAGGRSGSSTCSSTSSLGSTYVNMEEPRAARCGCKRRYDAHQSDLERLLRAGGSTGAQEGGKQWAPEQQEFGQCALDWHKDSHQHYHRNKLVALISAGMTTGSDKKYVTDTVSTLERLGYEVCVFIRRGVGGLKLSSSKFFSPAKWRDFEAAVSSVRQQRPEARLVAIGFSFGSIELCRYLSMSGGRSLVDAALLISCPFDPEAGGRNMRKRALNRRIDAYLAKNLAKQLHRASAAPAADQQPASSTFSNHNGSTVNLASLPKIKSLVDFEDKYNRVLQNYPSREAYAADSRLQEHLSRIDTPTLCLSSEDDFMAPLKLLPLDQIRANPNLCMVLTRRGGHMAFIDGLVWPKRPYFAQRIIASYMAAVRARLQLQAEPRRLFELEPASEAQVMQLV